MPELKPKSIGLRLKKDANPIIPTPVVAEHDDETMDRIAEAEHMAREELDAVKAAMRAQDKETRQAYEDMWDSEYWIAVVFQTREQKEEFLAIIGLTGQDKYVDGMLLAERLGYTLTSRIPNPKSPKISQRLKELAQALPTSRP